MSEFDQQLRLPLTEDIGQMVRESGYYTSFNPSEVIQFLDKVAPVTGYFQVESVPDEGEAPEEIRREWLNLGLPVRAIIPGDDGHPVLITEAMDVLWQAQKRDAFWWWHKHLTDEWQATYLRYAGIPAPGEFPSHIANTHFLIFSENWGHLDRAV